MSATSARALLLSLAVALPAFEAAAAHVPEAAPGRYAVQRSALVAPAAGSVDGRYRVDARLAPPDPASGTKRTQAFELRATVKSLGATCGPVDPLFVDSYE